MSDGVMLSAFMPEYVSIRHLRYSLRQGRKREPLVAFQRKRMADINDVLKQSIEKTAVVGSIGLNDNHGSFGTSERQAFEPAVRVSTTRVKKNYLYTPIPRQSSSRCLLQSIIERNAGLPSGWAFIASRSAAFTLSTPSLLAEIQTMAKLPGASV